MSGYTDHDLQFLKLMTAQLESSASVIKFAAAAGTSTTEIAAEIAHGLLDIRRSCEHLFRIVVPGLSGKTADLDDSLTDVGEEYRHIYYHLTHTRFFDYILDIGEEDRQRR